MDGGALETGTVHYQPTLNCFLLLSLMPLFLLHFFDKFFEVEDICIFHEGGGVEFAHDRLTGSKLLNLGVSHFPKGLDSKLLFWG